MNRRLIIALGLLVCLPLAGLTFLAIKVAQDEREMAMVEWRALLEGRLQDLANGIAAQTEDVEREALRALEAVDKSTAGLRALVRNTPLVSMAFLLRADGKLRFPPNDETTSEAERGFLERTQSIWEGRAILYAPPRAEVTPAVRTGSPEPNVQAAQSQQVQRQQVQSQPTRTPRPRPDRRPRGSSGDSLIDLAKGRDSGWISWFWQEGLHLLLWRRLPEREPGDPLRGVIGVEIDRVAGLGRILGRLPDPANLEGRIVLVSGRGEPIAQWGPHEPAKDADPAAWVALAPPWQAFQLRYYPSPARQAGFLSRSLQWTLGLGVGAFALSLLGIAVYFYRESDREMRDAAQRVTFVTQVSHELKTPLTNIRLYAELLDRDLEDEEEGPRQRVGIIVAEAQRLSRLISNILTFSRQRRGKLTVSPTSVAVDSLVEAMVDQFRPALAAASVEVELTLNAPEATYADPDTVDQILANLLSNVEKYASDGGWVGISTRQDESHTYLTVSDRGPGIAKEHRDRIFLPFYRVSDRLSDGVTGTGIGLALSAELARKNRGALKLGALREGACFELKLPRAKTGGR